MRFIGIFFNLFHINAYVNLLKHLYDNTQSLNESGYLNKMK